jgi:uncharacterized membrane protein
MHGWVGSADGDMEFGLMMLWALPTLLVLGGAIAGVVAVLRVGSLAQRVHELTAEVAALRREMAAPAGPSQPRPLPSDRAGVAEPQSTAPPAPPLPSLPTAVPSSPPGKPSSTEASRQAGMRWLEELAGGRLSVLLGGVALALGGIFLVRYTIEQGLLGPAARIALGLLFAAVLAAAGDYLRRSERRVGVEPVANAYIPGVLTGAAIVTAFASIYAAYALYGFIGTGTAFVLLAACSIAGLAVSALHGPGLAALGLVGSYATPLLIGGSRPDSWLLFGYLLVVTFACYVTSFLRGWRWLAIAATIAADVWGLFWQAAAPSPAQPWAHAVYVSLLVLMTILLLRPTEDQDGARDAQATPRLGALGLGAADLLSTACLAGHALLAVVLAFGAWAEPASLWLLFAISAMLLGAAWSWRSLALAPVIGGVAVVLALFGSTLGAEIARLMLTDGDGGIAAGSAHWSASVFGLIYGGVGFWVTTGRRSTAVWPAVSAAVPVALFVYAYWVATHFGASWPYAALGAGLAIVSAVAAEVHNRTPRSALADWTVANYAAGAVAFLVLGLSMALEKGWLTIALALIAPGLAAIERVRPIGVLRWLIAGLAALAAVRLVLEPTLYTQDFGRLPLLNWLLVVYGIPALAFAVAARLLRQGRDDVPAQAAEAAAIAFGAALIGMQVHHLMTGGVGFLAPASLGEYGVHAMTWLGLAIGLRLRGGARIVPRMASYLFGGLGMASLLVNDLLLRNPVVTGEPVGGNMLLNDLLLAYGLPAVLCGLLYRTLKGSLPRALPMIAAGAGLVLAFVYLSLMVGRVFEGPVIAMSEFDAGELYAFSAVWLLFALAMLAAGIGLGSAILRQAAFGVLLIVVLKVFFVDLAGLTGLLQAASFIGLGAALVGIGFAYQRLVLRTGRT